MQLVLMEIIYIFLLKHDQGILFLRPCRYVKTYLLGKFSEINEKIESELFWTEDRRINTVGDGYGEEKMKQYIKN